MATLPRLHFPNNGLKPTLATWLQTHPWRTRAKALDTSAITAYRYVYQQHGTDVLLYWYAQVRQLGEHQYLWGVETGMSPSRFVAEAVQWDIVILADEETAWLQGDGIVGVGYADDAYPPARQRLHFWVAPLYRHPRTTDALVAKVLPLYFDRYAVLWGITPATRHAALRAIRRWGFQQVGRLPQSEVEGERLVDGVVSAMTRLEWEAQTSHVTGE